MNTSKNVYLVDDVQENLQVLGNILRENGYNIALAKTGQQALKGICKMQPDLILLDISMPDMNGFEVCEQLKKNECTADIPIIFLTAKTQTEDIIEGFKVGGVDYITKPFNSEELLVRVKTHVELRKAKLQLEMLNKTKDKFFSIIGHDLKAPLNTIKGFTKLLQTGLDNFDQKELEHYINKLDVSAHNTSKLLQNLLDWARTQTGAIRYNPIKSDVETLIGGTIDLFQAISEQKGIEIKYEHRGLPLAVSVDKNMVQTIVRNLISNAIKFTEPGGVITVFTGQEDACLCIKVKDSGVGMSSVDCDKIFKPDIHFTRKGTNAEIGTGLGLLLCQEFVQYHDGHIGVNSTVNKGTEFTVKLPV